MIGERLCDLRKDRGMTQQQLADVLHLTKHNISAYERDYNEAPDDVKIAIAKYFHVSVDYLLGLTNRPNQYESPGSRLPANKKLPEDVQHIIKTLIRLISMATAATPCRRAGAQRHLSFLFLYNLHFLLKVKKDLLFHNHKGGEAENDWETSQ